MSTFKRGRVYWYKFQWSGVTIRQSTGQGNDKVARKMEAAHKGRLVRLDTDKAETRERLGCTDVTTCAECEELFNAAKTLCRDGNVFCGVKCAGAWGKARSMPTLGAFLESRFIPDAEVTHKATPATIRYYRNGVSMLLRSTLTVLRLDELTGEHSGKFATEFASLSPSGINMGLRTLRRALNLAFQWGVIDKPVRVELARGEVQRDRVLTSAELEVYLESCPQPWQDCAALIVDEGLRPGEAFALRWEHILLGGDGTGLIRVIDGKSKAARRILPMTPAVYAIIKARWDLKGRPAEGWVFASQSKTGHLERQTAKRQHATALAASRVQAFVPYTLRHTALTRLAKAAGGDVFALARIAGHSSITISQKYVHPEAETVDGVFARLGIKDSGGGQPVGTKPGTAYILPNVESP